MYPCVPGNHFWVGATRLPDDLWYWKIGNSSVIYNLWDHERSQPSNKPGEDCMGIYLPNKKWHDHKTLTLIHLFSYQHGNEMKGYESCAKIITIYDFRDPPK
jgi:hypothetical protein